MGWWVYLVGDDDEPVTVPRHLEGGVVAIGGMDTAEMSVTYNYGGLFRSAGVEFEKLDGQVAHDTIPALDRAVQALGAKRDDDYWAVTEGNAGHTLDVMRQWARAHPDAVWRIH